MVTAMPIHAAKDARLTSQPRKGIPLKICSATKALRFAASSRVGSPPFGPTTDRPSNFLPMVAPLVDSKWVQYANAAAPESTAITNAMNPLSLPNTTMLVRIAIGMPTISESRMRAPRRGSSSPGCVLPKFAPGAGGNPGKPPYCVAPYCSFWGAPYWGAPYWGAPYCGVPFCG